MNGYDCDKVFFSLSLVRFNEWGIWNHKMFAFVLICRFGSLLGQLLRYYAPKNARSYTNLLHAKKT